MNNEDLTAKVADIAGLVEYQSGSIVSRTIIDKDAGTLTLFAFGEGQGLSEHTVPYDAMYIFSMARTRLPFPEKCIR